MAIPHIVARHIRNYCQVFIKFYNFEKSHADIGYQSKNAAINRTNV